MANTNEQSPGQQDWASLSTILEACLAVGVLMAVLIAVGNTEAGWPIALGIVGVALAYHLLNHADQLKNVSSWLNSKVA